MGVGQDRIGCGRGIYGDGMRMWWGCQGGTVASEMGWVGVGWGGMRWDGVGWCGMVWDDVGRDGGWGVGLGGGGVSFETCKAGASIVGSFSICSISSQGFVGAVAGVRLLLQRASQRSYRAVHHMLHQGSQASGQEGGCLGSRGRISIPAGSLPDLSCIPPLSISQLYLIHTSSSTGRPSPHPYSHLYLLWTPPTYLSTLPHLPMKAHLGF